MPSTRNPAEIVWPEPDYGPPPKLVRVEFDYARKPGRKPQKIAEKVDEAEAARLVAQGGRVLS